ncbi:hypothetical protein Tco_0894680 [Tanacetum coccineum]|uniref:Uncharacterized protein n=1 Tax=Tanacetum coccineum TaxID=301880 RepID=A0ABQ5CDP7_9ASTR
MSPGHSAKVTEEMALSDSAFYTNNEEDEIGEEDTDEDKGHVLDDEDHSLDDEGHGLDNEDHSLDDEGHGLYDDEHSLDDEGCSLVKEGLGLKGSEEEAVPEGQQRAASVVDTVVGHDTGSIPEPERPERVSALRHPTLTTWIDLEDSIAYIDVPIYLPLAPPAQTLPSPEWSSGSLPVSPAPSAVSSPIPSPMISLTVLSPIASPVATLTATISIDEDQFIEVGAQLELYGSVLHEHTQRLDAMPPTLFRSLELEQERTVMTFGALWRPVLALEAWAGHVDTRMADLSWVGYDDHRLIHDMLVQQAALQLELQEMRGRVTALEPERDRRER